MTKTRMEEKRKEKRERELLRVYDSLVVLFFIKTVVAINCYTRVTEGKHFDSTHAQKCITKFTSWEKNNNKKM